MHKKSFTFGLGVGILIVTGIFYLLLGFINTEPAEPGEYTVEYTIDEIIQMAQDRGLIIMENINIEDEPVTEEEPPLEEEPAPEEEPILEEEPLPDEEDDDDPPTAIESIALGRQSVSVTIPPGGTATEISALLSSHQVIYDEAGFTSFLIQQGYATRLRARPTTFYINSTFQEALHALTN